jgi:hypothetical protein
MIELIGIICSLAICILTPIEVGKIRGGWVRKKFAGDRAKFLTAYRAQLKMLTWLGLFFGVLFIGLAFLETEPGESVFKLIAAVIWFAVSAITFVGRRMLAEVPDTGSPTASAS